MIVRSMFTRLSSNLMATGDKDYSISNFLVKEYIMFGLLGEIEMTTGFNIHIRCFNNGFSCVSGRSGSQCHYLHLLQDDTSNFIYV